MRELKSELQIASLGADASGEILAQQLTSTIPRMSESPGDLDLRAALRRLELSSLSEALARTNWNVTEAAHVLGLPRRTAVYRMSRLGLKRPKALE